MEEGDQDESLPQQWHSDLEKALAAAVGDPPKPKYKKGPCLLRCDFFHPNKSAFFCKLLRKKTLDEKRALVKNAGLYALCLARTQRGTRAWSLNVHAVVGGITSNYAHRRTRNKP